MQSEEVPSEPVTKKSKISEENVQLIIDQLNGDDALDALKAIADDSSKIAELLNQGGTGKDLLSFVDNSVEKLKAPDISIVFSACETFLLHISSALSNSSTEEEINKLKKLAIDLTRELLEDHLGYAILLLSATNTAYQVRSSLRLFTSMVTCCPQTAKEVLVKLDFEHKNWESVAKRQSSDIRKAYVQFILSFFVTNYSGIAKDFLEKKALVVGLLPGLVKDESETVQLVLTSFKENILENTSISKTAKMKLFSVYNLKHILSLFHWKVSEDKEPVIEATIEFLVAAFTSTKSGLVFHDPTYGTSGSNQNLLMFNLIISINEPWARPDLAKIVIAALASCPDQIRPYIVKVLQPLWTPRPSEAWLLVVDFLYAILETIDIGKIIKDLSDKSKQLSMVASNFCCNERVFKEVIQECINHEASLVKAKGVELQALLTNKLDILLQSPKVSASCKRQVLFRLQDKVPTLNQIYSVWNQEAAKEVIDIEQNEEVAKEENNVNYLLACTQVISFYLSHFPEKYSSSDLDLDSMLQKTRGEKNWLVQLHLLKHLVTSLSGISTNEQNLSTLVHIAAKNFDDENGNLALDALFLLLSKHNLCERKLDLQLWFAFIKPDKLSKVCQLLTQAIINLLGKKDGIFEEVKKEMNKLGSVNFTQSEMDVDKLMENLMNECLPEVEYREEFSLSPLIWQFLRSAALMHHKSYFEKCVLACLIVQDDPVTFRELLKLQDLRSFPTLKNLENLPLPDCSQHLEFSTKMEKMHAICLLKLNGKVNEEFIDKIEETDVEWILNDKQILVLFDPVSQSDLNRVLLKVFSLAQGHDLKPFVDKTIKSLEENQKDLGHLGDLVSSLPLKTEDLIALIEKDCSNTSILIIELNKLCKVDKWSLRQFKQQTLRNLANILESILLQSDESSRQAMPSFRLMVELNQEFRHLITATHLSLACDNEHMELVETLVKHDEMKQHFRKWILANLGKIPKFHHALVIVLKSGNAKTKLINGIKKYIKGKDEISEGDQELLYILVEQYDQDLLEFDQMGPCKAHLQHLKKVKKAKEIVSKILVPTMKSIGKLSKDPEQTNKLSDMTQLLDLAIQDLKPNTFKVEEFESYWPSFIKTCLKYGLRNDYSCLPLEALNKLFELVLEENCSTAGETYELLCSHSQFVPILFSSLKGKKEALLRLTLTLIKSKPSLCSSVQVPVFLGAYGGKMNLSDQTLLEILYIHESQGAVSLQAFKPLVWGQAAVSKFSLLTKAPTKMAKSLKVSEVLALIQPEKMFQSALNFNQEGDFYDPKFFLPLICQLCAPDNFVDKHLKLMESGCLALAFASLSCRDTHIRQLGLVTLSRIYKQLERARKSLSAEKQVWLHLVDLVRNGLAEKLGEAKIPPRIPHLTTAFIVKTTRILSNPLDPLFKSVSSFLLAKPMMDLFAVPEFLRLFHSNDVTNCRVEQEWILSVIKEGIKDELDYGILQQNFIPKMLMSYAQSSLASNQAKSLILDIVNEICIMTSPAFDMIRSHGVLLWLNTWEGDGKKILTILNSIWQATHKNLKAHHAILEMASLTRKLARKMNEKELFLILRDLIKRMTPSERQKYLSDLPVWQEKATLLSDVSVDSILIELINL